MALSTSEVYPQARLGPSGELIFPHRGNPPKSIQGYVRDEGDHYVFKPIYLPCIHRGVFWKKVCGGMIQCIQCSHYQIKVHISDCLVCKERKE